MQVFSHPYRLTPRHAMNAVSTASIREGVLLKWMWDDGKVGYSDLHPWPELGDVALPHQLEGLRQGQFFPQVDQSLWLAERDAAARAEKRNLFTNPHLLKNNYILSSPKDLNHEMLTYLHDRSCETVKIKMGKDLIAETKAVAELSAAGLKIRLDFNGTSSPTAFKDFVQKLPSEVLSAIDYVEDPFAYDLKNWQEAQNFVPLAIDQDLAKVVWEEISPSAFGVVILKPAKTSLDFVLDECKKRNLKITVTSYMDHPVGVMHAAILASELKEAHGDLILQSGCLTHQLYQNNPFSDQMSMDSCYLNPVAGTGIGFDKLFAEVPWQPLARL